MTFASRWSVSTSQECQNNSCSYVLQLTLCTKQVLLHSPPAKQLLRHCVNNSCFKGPDKNGQDIRWCWSELSFITNSCSWFGVYQIQWYSHIFVDDDHIFLDIQTWASVSPWLWRCLLKCKKSLNFPGASDLPTLFGNLYWHFGLALSIDTFYQRVALKLCIDTLDWHFALTLLSKCKQC